MSTDNNKHYPVFPSSYTPPPVVRRVNREDNDKRIIANLQKQVNSLEDRLRRIEEKTQIGAQHGMGKRVIG